MRLQRVKGENNPKRSQAGLKSRSAAVSCHIEAVRTATLSSLLTVLVISPAD
jgi:hypothetical protein